jgi:hypothetical protein
MNMDFDPYHNAEEPIQWYKHCIFSVYLEPGEAVPPPTNSEGCYSGFDLSGNTEADHRTALDTTAVL